MRNLISIGRYMGGKIALCDRILSWLPDCKRLVSPCAGFYTIELNYPYPRPRVAYELNPRTANLLVQIRDNCDLLINLINVPQEWRTETFFKLCWQSSVETNPLADAACYYWVARSRFGGAGTRWDTGVTHARMRRCQYHDASDLLLTSSRLQGVSIRCADGLVGALEWDSPSTLFYIDPTYENSVRGAKDNRVKDPVNSLTRNQYAVETDQRALVETALSLQGMVVVSGYPNALYDEAFSGWVTQDFSVCDSARNSRIERIWVNPQCWKALRFKGCSLAKQLELI